jgi:pimeloyl-ACP methyl ester carboxylesterase
MPFVDVAGERLFYREVGERRPYRPGMLLVHMAGGSSQVFAGVLAGMGGVTRVVAIDLPGHGRSGGRGRTDVAAYARVVSEAARALELASGPGVVVAGHSMGGAVALDVALDHREAAGAAGLVLMASGARLPVEGELAEALAGSASRLARFFATHAWSPATPAAVVRAHARLHLAAPREVVEGDFLACRHFDRVGDVARVNVPALVVAGADDAVIPAHFAEFLHDRIPASRKVVLAGAGHMVPVEAAVELREALGAWMTRQWPV